MFTGFPYSMIPSTVADMFTRFIVPVVFACMPFCLCDGVWGFMVTSSIRKPSLLGWVAFIAPVPAVA